jgi:hypothetical protein
VIATAEGMAGLADLMDDAAASEALKDIYFGATDEVDLSDGLLFPWVRWIYHQPKIVKEMSGGVTKFAAVRTAFQRYQGGPEIAGRVFRMDRLDRGPLALFPGLKSGSLLLTDQWGTYPESKAMQDKSEDIHVAEPTAE